MPELLDRLKTALADRYAIEHELGAGGMATVYLAQDVKHNRKVAVKVLRPELAAILGAERFLKEIEVTANLQHPHILPLFDSGEADSFLYYVMPYVEGESLRDRLNREKQLPIDDAIQYAREVADALSSAHSHGVIHRDIKPDNIFIEQGHAVIADFGIALAVNAAGGNRLTETGLSLGTPAYMSPEQATGDRQLGPAADIYSLGAVLYEMLTGDPPHLGNTAQAIMAKVLTERPTRVTAIRDGVPRHVEFTVHKALAKVPADRHATAAVLREALSGEATVRGSGVRHRIALAAVVVIAAIGWVALQVVDVLTQKLGLPPWAFVLAVALVIVSLSVVFVTATLHGLGRKSPAWSGSELEGGESPASTARRLFTWRNALIGGAAVSLLWIGVAAGWLVFGRGPSPRNTVDAIAGLVEVQELVGDARYAAAYVLAKELEPGFSDDSLRTELWSAASRLARLTSEPAGADVWMRPYDSREDDWEFLGRTPIDQARVAVGVSRLRFELEGYRSLYIAARSRDLDVLLDPEGSLPDGMLRVRSAAFDVFMPGLEHLSIALPDYFIDAGEVTNRQFKRFVDAGGYDTPEYWEHPFVRDGREVSWSEAMTLFRDRTGRQGPSTWEVGSYLDRTDDHPVGGVSWYEAAAYARFVGRQLPTLFHWYRAATPGLGQYIVPHSNFGTSGPAPVGQFDGLSISGAWDMAGNVREWTYNRSGDDRFILGGGWTDPEYMFTDANAQSPLDRSEINGFRLMVVGDTVNLAASRKPITQPSRDYFAERPASDEIFEVYRRLYSYDHTPLNTVEVARETADHWTREQVEIDAAYGEERLTAFLYVPGVGSPPYQTIVYFPGSGAISRVANPTAESFLFDFVMKSGRAVLWPIYKGTYSRGTELRSDIQDETNSYREHVIQWSKDLGRSIDYLETRPDIDMERIGYLGFSWGSAMAPIMTAVETRLKANLLISGGLVLQPTQPEVDPFNFLPRVRIPTLMINVPNDYFYPLEASQEPFFSLLGVPDTEKDHILLEGGHLPPMNAVARAGLDWFDRYLGPVGR